MEFTIIPLHTPIALYWKLVLLQTININEYQSGTSGYNFQTLTRIVLTGCSHESKKQCRPLPHSDRVAQDELLYYCTIP
jgi:hypothetical protein